jgi:hypothetical protein
VITFGVLVDHRLWCILPSLGLYSNPDQGINYMFRWLVFKIGFVWAYGIDEEITEEVDEE